jgi:pimeloyl-ACP methyl ester carboxylesterase
MGTTASNPWENETLSSLVDIKTHKLHISTSGPARKPGSPVIIFFTGGGAPAIAYTRLQRLLAATHRVYFYDRAGYDRSEPSPHNPFTAQHAATELHTLLDTIRVPPPYILVGHSYGGIVARTFLQHMTTSAMQGMTAAVQGMVLVDAATELVYALYPELPDRGLAAVAKGLELEELIDLRGKSGLTEEEWKAVEEAAERTHAGVRHEVPRDSGPELAGCQQFRYRALTPWPVVVFRCGMGADYQLMYEAGVAKGQGTEEEREQARAFIEKWELFDDQIQAGQLRLSRTNRYEWLDDAGHYHILLKPEEYVEVVDWVVDQRDRQDRFYREERRF